jgi:glycosyltransferase involved in cell wall biosynthesis
MRVLVLGDLHTIHSVRWVDALKEHFEVHALSLEKPIEERKEFTYLRTRIRSERWKYILNLHRVRTAIEAFDPDVLNPHFIPNYGLLSALASGGRPCVLSVWGSDLLQVPKKSAFHRRATRWILRRMDRIVADARMMIPVLRDFGVEEERVYVMPFGLDKEVRETPLVDLPGPPWRIVSHRRLVPEMDPGTVVEALGFLRRKRSDFEAVLCSEGPLRDHLLRRTEELGLADRVRFPGSVDDEELHELLRTAHIYVSASLTDSTSVSLLEAMACGAYPVVSDIEGNREWVRDRENGMLFEAGDPVELAERIEAAMDEREGRLQTRRTNKDLVTEKANWERNVGRFADMMRELGGSRAS